MILLFDVGNIELRNDADDDGNCNRDGWPTNAAPATVEKGNDADNTRGSAADDNARG